MANDFYYFSFDIDPLPHNSTKLGKRGFYVPSRIRNYKNALKIMAAEQWHSRPMDDALKVELIFHMPRPKSVKRKYAMTKPDLDNLEKPFYDSLEGIVYTQDSRICVKQVSKQYSLEGKIELKIWKLK